MKKIKPSIPLSIVGSVGIDTIETPIRERQHAQTGLGLIAVRALYSEYQTVAHLDWAMTFLTIALAIVAALLAGIYPTWRACRVQPAAQLKV